jgi:putative oxidoreductase
MRKFLSTKYSAGAFNTAMLFLRLVVGGLLAKHGYDKMVHFQEYSGQFMNFMGLGTKVSLSLAIFAEFFCSLLVIIGLFTRLACIPIIFLLCVALFKVHGGDVFGDGQPATLYLIGFVVLLFTGAGKVSVDSMISK